MSKAIIVMNMPKKCGNCPICQGIARDGDYVCSIQDEDGNERGWNDGGYSKPDWCPLKPLPEKQKLTFATHGEDMITLGWNAAIEAIEGG